LAVGGRLLLREIMGRGGLILGFIKNWFWGLGLRFIRNRFWGLLLRFSRSLFWGPVFRLNRDLFWGAFTGFGFPVELVLGGVVVCLVDNHLGAGQVGVDDR
jgi:hypothetical protein